jgi:disulfide oxidoreductase YuzD
MLQTQGGQKICPSCISFPASDNSNRLTAAQLKDAAEGRKKDCQNCRDWYLPKFKSKTESKTF